MLTTISELDVQSSSIGGISVGQVGIGPVHIGELVLTDVAVNLAGAGAHLRNFRVIISQTMSLDWHIHIDLPVLPPIDKSGTVDFGTHGFEIDFGDVNVPGIQNLAINVASLSAKNIAASANPLSNIQLGTAVAEQIKARNVKLPVPGFAIAGASIGSLQAAGLGIPAASVDALSIGRIHGDAFPLGEFTLSNLALPGASIPTIASQSVDVTATPLGKAFHFDLGILEETLKIQPKAETHIDRLTIDNASGNTSIGTIKMHNVVAPFEFLNLTLSQVGIQSIQVPVVSLS